MSQALNYRVTLIPTAGAQVLTSIQHCAGNFSGLDLTKIMSTIANVERKIHRVEGFDVRILHLRGADVRGDRTGLPQYHYIRAADNDITVETWKQTRFRPSFAGFEVEVLDGRGRSVQGNMKLSTVRDSY